MQRSSTLASEPAILDRFAADLRRLGLVGEERAAKLLYLILTSRLFDRPVSAAVKGPSAGGKSYTVEAVLEFFPDNTYHEYTAMSERALAYDDTDLRHRVLVIFEAVGMEGDIASYLIRSLLSEGRIAYVTVEKGKEGMKARRIERQGPTGLIVTTTRHRLHPENETRLISIPVSDSAAQTKAVMSALADEREPIGPDVGEWHTLQWVLSEGETGVHIPYGPALAEAVPPAATRLRRDFGAILGLIRAHALLHRANRGKDEEGRTIAAVEDYAVVRELVADLVSEGVGRTVSPETRETVEAVGRLQEEHPDGVTLTVLSSTLQLDKSTVSRRARKAQDGGYLRNLEDRKGRPSRLMSDDPLPDEVEILPDPSTLEDHRCTVAPLIKGVTNGLPPAAEIERAAVDLGLEVYDEVDA